MFNFDNHTSIGLSLSTDYNLKICGIVSKTFYFLTNMGILMPSLFYFDMIFIHAKVKVDLIYIDVDCENHTFPS